MEIIQLTYPLNRAQIPNQPIVLALGFFDGVHLAHQRVIQVAKDKARSLQLPLAVMTFNQHPSQLHHPEANRAYPYLSTLTRKIELMAQFGVDYLYIADYNAEFAAQTPQQFVDDYLVGLHAQVVVAGFDYTYGIPALANMTTLPRHSQGRFEIIEVPEYTQFNEKISSSIIRQAILAGEMERANSDLGYIYTTTGTVIHGQKRGRTLGFPTANLALDPGQLTPAIGVYAVRLQVGGQWYLGAASIGYNVTFTDRTQVHIEVHLLDFSEDIYGQSVKVEWHHYLRGEIKFDNVEGLIDQLRQDVEATHQYFAKQ